jgi:hypothetical protein
MIYVWKEPENTKNRDIGEYDQEGSPDQDLLIQGRALTNEEFSPLPTVHFEVKKSRILQFDCLPNNACSVPLVNQRIKTILENMALEEVQFFPAQLICPDGGLEGYYYLNVTHKIKGIDHDKSIYTKRIIGGATLLGFKYLTYHSDCMGNYMLARDEEYLGNLLVNEKIKEVFGREHIKGAGLVRPEEYYRPLTIQDLLHSESA